MRKVLELIFHGIGRPEDRCIVCRSVDTNAIFRIYRLLLQPQNSSVFGGLNVNKAILAGGVLECLEIFHGDLSLRSCNGRRWLCFDRFRAGHPSKLGSLSLFNDRNLQKARVLSVVIENYLCAARVFARLARHYAAAVIVFLDPNRVGQATSAVNGCPWQSGARRT